RCARGARARYALGAAAGLFLCIAPWALVFVVHGLNPITGESAASAGRLGEVSTAVRDPATLASRLGTTLQRIAAAFIPYATPGKVGVFGSGPGPLGLLFAAIAIGAVGSPDARPAISWRAMLGFAAALAVAQAIPVALAPSFDVQLELVADRAA